MNRKRISGLFFILLAILFVQQAAYAKPKLTVTLTVGASPDSTYESKLTLPDRGAMQRIPAIAKRTPIDKLPITDTQVTFENQTSRTTYLADADGTLYDPLTRERLELPSRIQTKLKTYIKELRVRHYGELIEWNEANAIIPKKSSFKVIDIETGLAFNVQRRAGSDHADVQPLTKADSAIMKQIYGGTWSWNRKAILVQTDSRKLAASMNGMPHGGDGIPDNGFSGHFCIHFLGSTTHKKNNVDVEHQLMVHKAAGQVPDFLQKANPFQLAEIFIGALNLNEQMILNRCAAAGDSGPLLESLTNRDQITRVRKRAAIETRSVTDADMTINVPVSVGITREGREERVTFGFVISRQTITDRWTIESLQISR